jgi:hypothetical protein
LLECVCARARLCTCTPHTFTRSVHKNSYLRVRRLSLFQGRPVFGVLCAPGSHLNSRLWSCIEPGFSPPCSSYRTVALLRTRLRPRTATKTTQTPYTFPFFSLAPTATFLCSRLSGARARPRGAAWLPCWQSAARSFLPVGASSSMLPEFASSACLSVALESCARVFGLPPRAVRRAGPPTTCCSPVRWLRRSRL